MHDSGILFLDGFDLFRETGNDTGQTLKDIQTCQLFRLHTSLVSAQDGIYERWTETLIKGERRPISHRPESGGSPAAANRWIG